MKSILPVSGLCLVSFSANSDHQNTLYGMFNSLCKEYEVSTVGMKNPIASNAAMTERNRYIECPVKPGIAKGTFNPQLLRLAVNAIKATGCKTIYFESVHIWNCAVMLLLGRGYTFVSTLHDVVPHDGSKTVYYCQKIQCALSNYVVIKSDSFINDAKRLYGIAEEKIISFGVWRDFPPYQFSRGDGSFLFFGRLRRYKGLENMLKIAKACPKTQFKIVGSPDNESIDIVNRLADLPNVYIRPEKVTDKEMDQLFRDSSWVVLPYESASQSGVIIDSYKYGRPVITFSVGAISAQVAHGKSGYLVSPDDIDGFCSAINAAQKMNIDKYTDMCRNSYQFGHMTYSTDALSEQFAHTFNIRKVAN